MLVQIFFHGITRPAALKSQLNIQHFLRINADFTRINLPSVSASALNTNANRMLFSFIYFFIITLSSTALEFPFECFDKREPSTRKTRETPGLLIPLLQSRVSDNFIEHPHKNINHSSRDPKLITLTSLNTHFAKGAAHFLLEFYDE